MNLFLLIALYLLYILLIYDVECPQKRVIEEPKVPPSQPSRMNEKIIVNISPALGVTSPRQRNRIRTNPWLPGSTLSPSPVKHDLKKASVATKSSKDSP